MSKLQANQLEDTVLSDSDIGVSVQAHSANLDEFAAVNPTAAGLALLDDADAATQRTTLGLGTLDSPQFAGINLGHATNTTITSPAAGRAQIEGREVVTAAADATELTSNIAELNKNDDSAAAISGYVSGMRTYIKSSGTRTDFDVDANIAASTYESIGPTGSGATNIWSDMDDIPDGASAVIISCLATVTANGTTGTTATINVRQTGETMAHTALSRYFEASNSGDLNTATAAIVFVPIDSSKRFDLRWASSGASANDFSIGFVGFIL